MALECAYHGYRHERSGVHTNMTAKCAHAGCHAEAGDLVAITEDEKWWFCEAHACSSPDPLMRLA